MSVTTKALAIATLDTPAEEKLTGVLPLAEYDMRAALGNDEYDAYRALPEDNKKRDELEYAEACLAVYHLALALRGLKQGTGPASTVGWGQGQITPVAVNELDQYREQYRKKAYIILERYQQSAVGNADVRMYAI